MAVFYILGIVLLLIFFLGMIHKISEKILPRNDDDKIVDDIKDEDADVTTITDTTYIHET